MARVQDAVNANGGDLWGDKQWWEKIEKGVKSWRALYALVQHGASLKKGCHPTHGKGYIAGIEKALGLQLVLMVMQMLLDHVFVVDCVEIVERDGGSISDTIVTVEYG